MSEQDMSLRKQRTPQMTELRSLWVDHRCRELPNENPCSEVVKEICAEFDRAIAAHDAELRETWREPSVEAIAVMLRHTFDWDGEVILTDVVEAVLSCRHSSILQHDTELREQIARDIEARKPRASKLSEYVTGVRRGIYLAASIARGKAS